MESTGVAASIPETESVDASSFVQASREVPTGSVWALKSCGETFLCFLAVVLFVWVSLSALVALVLGAVVRFCRPFSRCWILSGVLFRARFPLCFVRQGDDPRTDLWQVTPLYGGSGTGLQHCVFVGYECSALTPEQRGVRRQ